MDVLDGARSFALTAAFAILPVRDMHRSVAFYAQLGFAAELYDGAGEYAFLSRDGQTLHLRLASDLGEGAESPAGVYFYTGDVDVVYDELSAAGVARLSLPEDQPWGMREFAVSDPDGTLLRFGQRANRPLGG